MGFLDKVKSGVKTVAGEVGKEIEKEKERQRQGQERRRQKLQILNQLDMSGLQKMCKNMGIGEPIDYDPIEYSLYGKKTRFKLTRDHYVNHIINKLTVDQIRGYAEKMRINVPEIEQKIEPVIIKEPTEDVDTENEPEKVEDKPKVVNKDEEKLKKILHEIKELRPKRAFEKESEYENTVYTRLEVFFPNIESQVSFANSRVDIKIDKFGIEIKNHPDQNEINRLIGQLISYRRFFKHIIVVIFNPKDYKAIKYLKEQIKELNLAVTIIEK